MSRRVVISGLGAVTGFGMGASALWEGLLAGETSLRRIEGFDASSFPCGLAAEAPDFSARKLVPKSYRKAVKVMARDIELAVGAAHDLVEDAGLITKASESDEAPTFEPSRVGCHIGAGLINCEIAEVTMALATARRDDGLFDPSAWGDGAIDNLPPLWLLKYLPNMLACHVTILHDARGPSNTITCAEASGLLSVGESMRVVQRGHADMCFSGGAESKINPVGIVRMSLVDRLANTNGSDDGLAYVRPFDAEATGSLMGEGAGLVCIEELESARKRGARIYAEVTGFGAGQSPRSGDAQRRSGGYANAINAALRQAGVSPSDIDAIVPHASGIPEMDESESCALRAVFGDHLAETPMVTLTPAIGETMAGSGALALCAGALCAHHQTLPARLHTGNPPEDLQVGATTQRDARLRNILVCTNALGGQNAALVLSPV